MKFGVASLQKQLGFMADHVWNSTDSVEFPGVSLRLDSTAIRWPSATDSESKCSILLRKDCSFKKTSIPLKLCENRSFKFPSSQRMLFQPSKFRKEHMNPTENWKGWRKKKERLFQDMVDPRVPYFLRPAVCMLQFQSSFRDPSSLGLFMIHFAGALQYLTTVMGHHMAAHGGSLGTPVYYLQKMVYAHNNIQNIAELHIYIYYTYNMVFSNVGWSWLIIIMLIEIAT